MKRLIAILFLVSTAFFSLQCANPQKEVFTTFIKAEGNKLKDGDKEFRFLSFNIPNLNFVEDEMEFTKPHAFRLPDSFEIRDALESVKQMGGTVVRLYTFPVKRDFDTLGIPRYVLGPGEFDENSFKTMDTVLAIANEVGVRLVVSFLNNWMWMGGRPQYAGFREKQQDEFWTDSLLISDFKKTVEFVLNRVNTVTGTAYKDDKAIMCWETGNELTAPYSWTHEIVSYVKSIDKNHLVMDGYHAIDGVPIPQESINDTLIDIVTSHHYELNPNDIIKHISEQIERVGGKKPYIVGEFGFLGTNAIEKISDYIINHEVSGGLIWSLRHHRREGGFYWHSEPLGGGIYKAFHWPGFKSGIEYNEEAMMAMYREKAFRIRGLEVPEISVPAAPKLLSINNVSEISWQGSAGAKYYDIERANTATGPWNIVGYNITDAEQTYTALFNDVTAEIGKEYFYRVIAKNVAGNSDASNVVGPVAVKSKTLIDNMENFTVLYYKEGDMNIATDNDREFKEIMSRINIQPGSKIYYFVPGGISGIKTNSFSNNDSGSLVFSISENGVDFIPLETERKSFYIGKGDYNYWIPSQYIGIVKNQNQSMKYVMVEATENNQIARIEIEYIPTK